MEHDITSRRLSGAMMTRRQKNKRSMVTANFDINFVRTVEELDDGTIRGLGKPLGGGINPPAYTQLPRAPQTGNHQYQLPIVQWN